MEAFMKFSYHKKQISTIAVALIFSFYMTIASAAPVAPTVRAPGSSAGTVSRETAATPVSNAPTAATPPAGSGKTNPSTPADTAQADTPPANTTQTRSETTAANTSGTTLAPTAKTQNTPATKTNTETVRPSATQKENPAVVPGHPFRIQNKEENYNSLLNKTATRKLDAALTDMIGGYGEKVPGLAVIVFKDGKEVYRNMMGNRFLSPRNKNWNLPVTSDSRFRVASISKIFTATGYMQLVEE